ncbi:hypothetical protein B0920_25145 [Massilia sp. KIM]|uniref:DUF2868 domain-containing protein n=1 Tax=Massilia sp. KIM TaxID=1955422 RepID=UPI00098F3383|nr:DUF2868 domain-containing protein [Massilia sp. KIM]OON59117.1 hypothetical protein B0920_25145 [Massilia sp. KIM]
MNEQVARKVVLMRAIETADVAHAVLSDDDRKYATRSARELAAWQASDSRVAMNQHHFLEQRADQILKRLGERTPALRAFVQRKPGMTGIWAALPFIAFLAGAALDRIADPHRVDLLSAPFLLIIAWNLLVYLGLLVWAILPAKRKAGNSLLQRLSVGKAAVPRKLPSALADGVAHYLADWAALSEPLTRARLSRTFHLAAAGFALGAIASLYARGLFTDYITGWESTFLDGRQVHTLLSWLFTPALTVFPFLQGFSLAEIEMLRFGSGGTIAGGERWVHLYAATLLLLVVLPRLVLALIDGLRAGRLKRRFPLDLDQPYFRKLADSIGAGAPALLRVIPYSYTLDEARDRGLWAIAASAFGAQARVQLRPTAGYGVEPKEALRDTALDESGVTVTAALFSLAATPEKENHGAFLDYLVKRVPRGVAVLLDESALVERIGEQPASAGRVTERAALWRQFCSFHGTPAQVVNLLQPDKHPVEFSAGLNLPELR